MENKDRTKNKRRRTSSPCSQQSSIADLPDPLLQAVAAYLPTISRGFFAVAVMAPSSSWCHRLNSIDGEQLVRGPQQISPASKAITFSDHSQYDIINFEDIIGKNLAKKLKDEDLAALLLCIHAKRVLKRLHLAGCVNIVGHGLEPLRGSVVLEQIDLTCMGRHEDPDYAATNQVISADVVLPILSSIVDEHEPGPSLKHIQIPHIWYRIVREQNASPAMASFMADYGMLLDSRPFDCLGCTSNQEDCCGTNGQDWLNACAVQSFTCYSCLCNCCGESGGIGMCERCCKRYCGECSGMADDDCGICGREHCEGCAAFEGDSCDLCETSSCKGCDAVCDRCNQRCSCGNCSFCRECDDLYSAYD